MSVWNSKILMFPILFTLLNLGSSPSFADSYSEQWGPMIGTDLPGLNAKDHEGRTRSFDDLKGKNGLLLFMNRSADW